MKTCSLDDFMAEMQPWLDTDHLRNAHLNEHGHFVLQFQDGMQKVYDIDDCNLEHVRKILKDLAARGISTKS
jgi:hypothetical protein